MFKVLIVLATAQMAVAFDAADAGVYRAQILAPDGTPVASQDSAGTSFEFDGIAAGEYTATAVRLDVNGTQIGTGISQPFTVAAETPVPTEAPTEAPVAQTKAVDVPSTMTVTVTAA